MKIVFDPITLINLIFCLGVVFLSCWWHRTSKSRTPLYIGLAFGLFGVSHAAVLLDLRTSFEQVLIIDRIAAYVFVFIGLFFIAHDALKRQKAETEALRRNEELNAAYKEMTATAEELKNNYDELRMSQQALSQATKKLNLLNFIAFTDIQSAVFSLAGYIELESELLTDDKQREYHHKLASTVETIDNSLHFAKTYQDLGLKPACWQNVEQAFLFGISHLDSTDFSRNLKVKGLEIYADPMLERVFYNLAQNVVVHGKTATEVTLSCQERGDGFVLTFEDNGRGIPDSMKALTFERKVEEKRGMGLFLTREILEITGITIKETGTEGKGARFEMMVPKGAYRFCGTS